MKRVRSPIGRLLCRLGWHQWRTQMVITDVDLKGFSIPGGLHAEITGSRTEVHCRFCDKERP